MERETKELSIGENKVVVKTYITGGEMRDIEGIFTEGLEITVEEGKAVMPGISAGLAKKAQDKTIETLVVSVNGETENVLDKVLDLPKKIFDVLIDELNEMTEGLGKKKEKK